MPNEGNPEGSGQPDVADNRLRDANEQLTLTALRAQEQTEESAQRYRDLVEGLNAIVWEADADPWKFTFVNQQGQTILGYPVESWYQEPNFWIDLIHPDDRRHVVSACKAAATARQDFRVEYRAIAADGRVVWLALIARVRELDEGRAQLRGFLLDSSESKRSEQLQRLVGELKASEAKLAEKNQELQEQNEEPENFHEAIVNRELKMIHLEKENKRLQRELDKLTSQWSA